MSDEGECVSLPLSVEALHEKADSLAAPLLDYCQQHELKVAAAESLTGGLLADCFVRIPGASQVFLGSAVTYDIAAKASILGIDRDLLDREGAVHPQVAQQMASATARLYGQDAYGDRVIGLSTTGVAGPGPDGDKPVGLVYIGLALPTSADVGDTGKGHPLLESWELRLQGPREVIRMQTVVRILQTVWYFTVYS